jgi:hypothetical protein
MREQTNKVKNWKQFLNESVENIADAAKLHNQLKDTINLLSKSDNEKYFSTGEHVKMVANKLGKLLAIDREHFFPGKKEKETEEEIEKNKEKFLSLWKEKFPTDSDITLISATDFEP